MLFIRSEVEPGEVVCHENQPYSCVHETEDPFFGFREVHPLLGDDQPHGCDGQKNEKEIVSAQGFFSVFEKKHAITLPGSQETDHPFRSRSASLVSAKRISQRKRRLNRKISLKSTVRPSGDAGCAIACLFANSEAENRTNMLKFML